MPPSSRTSPPRARPCTPTSVKPLWLNCTTPRAAFTRGASGTKCTSLPARVTLPRTVDWSMWLMGSVRPSCSSATPVAAARSSAPCVSREMGEALTSASMSGSGPRTSAPTTTSVCCRSAIFAFTFCTRSAGYPAKRPVALRTSMPARSNPSSPDSAVRAGQGRSPACNSAGGT